MNTIKLISGSTLYLDNDDSLMIIGESSPRIFESVNGETDILLAYYQIVESMPIDGEILSQLNMIIGTEKEKVNWKKNGF